jgi:hypothetical protein
MQLRDRRHFRRHNRLSLGGNVVLLLPPLPHSNVIMPSSSNKKNKRGKKKGGGNTTSTANGGVSPLLLTSLSALDDDEFGDNDNNQNDDEAEADNVGGHSDASDAVTTTMSTLTIDDVDSVGVEEGGLTSHVSSTRNDGIGGADGADDEEDEKLKSPTLPMSGQQILLALIRLADALAQLTFNTKSSNNEGSNDIETINHWRILPPLVKSAYQMLDDACLLLSNTATKYVLVAKAAAAAAAKTTLKTSSTSSNNNNNNNDNTAVIELASELLKGSEMVGAATYILYSDNDCGSSNALRKYIKQYSSSVILSVVALVQYFVERESQTTTTTTHDDNDNHNAAAQKAGAVWDACDKINTVLPRGNRNAIRRDVLNYVKDCNVTIVEFDELLLQSVNSNKDDNDCNTTDNNNSNTDGNENGNDDNDGMENNDNDDEIMYTAPEIKIVHASINIIKCSKNVLNLILATCEYLGANCVDALLPNTATDDEKHNAVTQRNKALCWITNLHVLANIIGEGVTELGVLLYPPLDFDSSTMNTSDNDSDNDRKNTTNDNNNIVGGNDGLVVTTSRLGQTTLGSKLEYQLRSIINVVTCIENIDFLSHEVVQEAQRLKGAVQIRLRECEEAMIVIVER